MGVTQRLTSWRTYECRGSVAGVALYLFFLLCGNSTNESPALAGLPSSFAFPIAVTGGTVPIISFEKDPVSVGLGDVYEGSPTVLHASQPLQGTRHGVPDNFDAQLPPHSRSTSQIGRSPDELPLSTARDAISDAFTDPWRKDYPVTVASVGGEGQQGDSRRLQPLAIFSPPFSSLYGAQDVIQTHPATVSVIPTISSRPPIRLDSQHSASSSFSPPSPSAARLDSPAASRFNSPLPGEDKVGAEAPALSHDRKRTIDQPVSPARSILSQVSNLFPRVPSLLPSTGRVSRELNVSHLSSSREAASSFASEHPVGDGALSLVPAGPFSHASPPELSSDHAAEAEGSNHEKDTPTFPWLLSVNFERAKQHFEDVKKSLKPTINTVKSAISSFVSEAPQWTDRLRHEFFDDEDEEDDEDESDRPGKGEGAASSGWPRALGISPETEHDTVLESEVRPTPASGLPTSFGEVLALQDDDLDDEPPGKRRRTNRKKVLPPLEEQTRKKMLAVRGWYTESLGGTMNGRRERDEDALVVHATLENFSNMRLFALFDGHSGFDVSRFCATNASTLFGQMTDVSPQDFREACLALDELLYSRPGPLSRSGSTGILVALQSIRIPRGGIYFQLHSVNVGDSRALLLRQNGTFKALSKDHKPNDEEERRRIEAAGGSVVRKGNGLWRVDGRLAVSRSFGDFALKREDSLPPEAQRVVAVPDVVEAVAFPGDILLLACDGLFEAKGMDWDFVAKLLHESLRETDGDLASAAYQLLSTAFNRGSGDNVSLVLTRLHSKASTGYTVRRFDLLSDGEILEYPFESEHILESQVPKGSRSTGVDTINFTLF